jgi:glycerol kinase
MLKQFLKNSRLNHNKGFSLVLDLGTTGVKAFIFDNNFNILVKAYQPLKKYFPRKGWVEQKPQEFLEVSLRVLQEVVKKSGLSRDFFIGFGLTNQRETTILWNKKTGKPIYPAIVWEDVRTKKFCTKLQKKYNQIIKDKTGLTLNPYFSASKIYWILQNVPEAKEVLRKNNLIFGTVDSWILWNFLENNPHLTDYTNASRTLLFNIKTSSWDKELLEIFQIPPEILPRVKPSQFFFGNLKKEILGFSLPVLAVCGDQQASLYAAGVKRGITKVTYGTGTFVMQVIGSRFITHNNFFTTLVPGRKHPLYALEMKINDTGKQVEKVLQKKMPLGSILRAIAEKVDKILKNLPRKPKVLIVDGGITRDYKIVSIQRSVSEIKVKPQRTYDGTALGVAKLINVYLRAKHLKDNVKS